MLHGAPDRATLASWLMDAHQRSVALVQDLSDDQILGPRLGIVNPLLWELPHVAWFYEKWNLRDGGSGKSLRADSDALYDSMAIAHDTRWDLPFPSRQDSFRYVDAVRDLVLEKIHNHDMTSQEIYFVMLSVFHADMHNEAFLYTRQTHGYPPPQFDNESSGTAATDPAVPGSAAAPIHGDVEFPFGSFELGADRRSFFVFDNEKWAHEVNVHAFAMSRTAVTQEQFRHFVEDGGYERQELWETDGWTWRTREHANAPLYWKRDDNGNWQRRYFNTWRALEPQHAMIHVNWFEAVAYCNWAKRRLPTEIEWEFAASTTPAGGAKRYFPWGDKAATAELANLDIQRLDTINVQAHAAGDGAWGLRQMIGNVWEWTADDFSPYPGFTPDPYKEYSKPWFDNHKVLRGGSWASRGRMLRNTWRSYYTPDRRDVWCGFRTCAPSV